MALGDGVRGGSRGAARAVAELQPALPGSLDPELSAQRVLSRGQAIFLGSGMAIVAGLLTLYTAPTGIALMVAWSAVYVLITIEKLMTSIIGLGHPIEPVAAPQLPETDLPRYTILVPLCREAAVVGGLIAAIADLDYPRDLVDVILLIEADDPETLEALQETRMGPQFDVLQVPAGTPRTKPRALNFGLLRAQGELVVVFDAEDRPEPDQLKKAAAAFSVAGPEVACFQARLGFWNRTTNLLTRYCTAEFCMIFDMVRPGLEHLDAPIPLGGTSNHFPVGLLRGLGGWDPFNVTEDADLGIRLARAGYRTRMLDSTTYEEANSRIGNWSRQQSRWIKGYLQTWLVQVRHPVRLWRDLGPRATAHFHLTMLAPVVPVLLAPLGLAATLLWLLTTAGLVSPLLPPWLLAIPAGSFILHTAAGTWEYVAGLRLRGYHEIVPHCVPFLLYRLIKSVAVVKALGQLITRPSYWEKTIHGLDAGVGDVAGPCVAESLQSALDGGTAR
jgi:glycosyltransferase involved in cell wall biosynthesis